MICFGVDSCFSCGFPVAFGLLVGLAACYIVGLLIADLTVVL